MSKAFCSRPKTVCKFSFLPSIILLLFILEYSRSIELEKFETAKLEPIKLEKLTPIETPQVATATGNEPQRISSLQSATQEKDNALHDARNEHTRRDWYIETPGNFKTSTFGQESIRSNFGGFSPKHFEKYFDLFAKSSESIKSVLDKSVNETLSKLYSNYIMNISEICPSKTMYSIFNPEHRKAVHQLEELYDDKTDFDTILELSAYLKTRKEIHPHVWYASFMKAHMWTSPWLVNPNRPSVIDLFPTDFFPMSVFEQRTQAERQGNYYNRTKRQIDYEYDEPMYPYYPPVPTCVVIDGSVGRDNGVENNLWYFREDIQLNAHHFMWHLIFSGTSRTKIPRRGELFYFVHHDVLARYRTERIGQGMKPLTPLFINEGTILPEGYNPHLMDGVSSMAWVPRFANTRLNEYTLNKFFLSRLRNLPSLDQRIRNIIKTKTIITNGQPQSIASQDYTNMLGELFESSNYSPNPSYYSPIGYHNDYHWIISNIVSNFPPGSIGVLGNAAAAVRDPMFYRIHAMMEDFFRAYKTEALPPYQLTTGEHPLVFPGVKINSLALIPTSTGSTPNNLFTFWSFRNFTLEGGLDHNPNSVNEPPNLSVCVKHLNHEEFEYSFEVNNTREYTVSAYIRIYMAPRYSSPNNEGRFTMDEQRSYFFILDSYVRNIAPGVTTITRRSIDSSLTAPWPRSVQQVRIDIRNGQTHGVNCQCGFPHHLLLPRGHERGMIFDVVVHITDGLEDFVRPNRPPNGCIPSHIHCGILGQAYPDAKPAGYPFDRKPYSVYTLGPNSPPTIVPNLETYVYNIPNMFTTKVTVTHQNIIV